MEVEYSKKQLDFFYSGNHDFHILSGKTGSAKSFIANVRLMGEMASDPPNSISIFSGNTFESLYDNVVQPFLDLDENIGDFEYRSVAGRPRMICKLNNSQAVLVGANNEGAEQRIQGKPSVRRHYGDEIVKQPKSFVDQVLSRLRYKDENGKLAVGQAFWTCNPDHPYHFIKSEYIDNRKLDVNNWYFDFWDNPIMTQEWIDKQKARYSGVFYQRMIEGKWVAAEGVVYDKFDRTKHVVTDYPKEAIKEYVLGIDWGYEHPMSIGLFAVDNDGGYWLIDEIHVRHQLIDATLVTLLKAKGWFDIDFHGRKVKPSEAYADSAMPAYIQQFYDLTGIPCHGADKGPGSVVQGIQEVQRHFMKKPNGAYGLRIMSNCVEAIRGHESYTWMAGRGGLKDEPKKENDDACDMVRYVIYTRRNKGVKMLGKNPFLW